MSGIKSNADNPKIVVISNNPAKIKQIYDVDSVYTFDYKAIFAQMKTSGLFISGGGSLLQDVTSFKSLIYYLLLIFLAEILKVKTYIYAQGIGPVNNLFGRILTSLILKNVDIITVRDQQSKNFLEKLGINSVLTADPVWSIEKEDLNNSILNDEKIKIGIQLRDWHTLSDTDLENLAEAININFNDKKYKLILISLQDSKDLQVMKNFEQILRSKNSELNLELISGLTVFDSISLISKLDYLIAMRYHACLISIKFNIPTLAISYDPKVEILSKESGIPYILANEINKEGLSGKIFELIDKREVYRNKLKDFAIKKQLESRQNVDLLIKILMENKIINY